MDEKIATLAGRVLLAVQLASFFIVTRSDIRIIMFYANMMTLYVLLSVWITYKSSERCDMATAMIATAIILAPIVMFLGTYEVAMNFITFVLYVSSFSFAILSDDPRLIIPLAATHGFAWGMGFISYTDYHKAIKWI